MKPSLSSLTLHLALVTACFGEVRGNSAAQGATNTEALETGIVLTKLSPPIYPPLARQARIKGDVKVQIGIRQDGSIESTEVVGGHPMFKQAALESAQKSTFECRGCNQPVTLYSLIYVFEVQNDGSCCTKDSYAPRIEQSRDRIDVIASEPCICNGAPVRTRVRSAKCLYLWKCGVRLQAVE